MKEQALVSVIIPVYNSEATLRSCVESLLGQIYPAWEAVLVDDGSTDGSLGLCRALAEEDARIKVIHQENGGVSSARNAGLGCAAGTYVAFVDGDDHVEPDWLSGLVKGLEDAGADLSVCGCWLEHRPGQWRAVSAPGQVLEGQRAIARFAAEHFCALVSPVWNKLYRRDRVSFLFDPALTVGEDLMFNLNYLARCDKIAVVDRPLYRYAWTEHSLTKGWDVAGRAELYWRLDESACRFLRAGDPELDLSPVHLETVRKFYRLFARLLKYPASFRREKRREILGLCEDDRWPSLLAGTRADSLTMWVCMALIRHGLAGGIFLLLSLRTCCEKQRRGK